jgi:CTP synthase (UTP-ammonia lyase)
MPDILDALGADGASAIDAYWVETIDVNECDLRGFDGVWLLPGSPYASTDGALSAVRFARESAVPFLGTCGGFQHMVLEFAWNVCSLSADHAENVPDAEAPLIRALSCSLVGEERVVHVVPGTRAADILGTVPRTERYFCSYGVDQRYVHDLTAAGLVIAGRDDEGEIRLAELSDHPFFIGSLFQPELSSTRAWVHPLIRAFVGAARARSAQRPPVSPVVSPGAELPGACSSPR